MNFKERLTEVVGTKLADKVDGVEIEITASDIKITMLDGKVDVETKNLKTKIRLAQNTKSLWETEMEKLRPQ